MFYLKFLWWSHILIVVFIDISRAFSSKVICSNLNQTISYDKEGIIFIESQNFPVDTTEECNITFNYQQQKNFRTMIVITNLRWEIMGAVPHHGITVYSNSTKISWENVYYVLTQVIYNATTLTLPVSANNPFQGYIVTDSWPGDDGCPLMSLTAENAFTFKDDSQILYLSSTYGGVASLENVLVKCRWRFISPKLYKFKLVLVSGINNLTNMVLDYGISQNMIIENENAILFTSYFLDGKVLNILYDDPPMDDNPIFDRRTSLLAFLSVVKINKHKAEAACKSYKTGPTTTIWELKGGYANNAKCSFIMPLLINKEIKVTLKTQELEAYNDIIRFYFDGKYTIYYLIQNHLSTPLDSNYDYAFRAQENGYNKNVTFEFISDGSIQGQGFSMIFEEGEECKCNNLKVFIAPCLGNFEFGIMSNKNNYYCGDLACNSTIKVDPLCPHKFIRANVYSFNGFFPNGTYYDNFQILSNEKTVLHSKNHILPGDKFIAYLSPSNENLLVFTSVVGTYPKVFNCSLSTFDQPKKFSNIILTKDRPTYVLDIGLLTYNSYISVELSTNLIAEKDVLEIFSNLMLNEIVAFYGTPNFDEIIFNNDIFVTTSKDVKSTKINATIIYVYRSPTALSNDDGMILFRATNAHTKNCYFKDNIFNSNNAAHNQDAISAIAKGTGDCEMILLAFPYASFDPDGLIDYELPPYFQIKKMWTTSKETHVKILSRSRNDELLLEFNRTSDATWMNIASSYYTIIVPPNSSVLLQFVNLNLEENLHYFSYPCKALIATPYYGTAKPYPILTPFGLIAVPKNLTLIMKILKFDISPFPVGFVTLSNSENTTILTNDTDIYEFTDISLALMYSELNIIKTGVLLYFEIIIKN